MASGLKNDMAKHLLDLNVSTFSMTPVKVCKSNHCDVSKCLCLTNIQVNFVL